MKNKKVAELYKDPRINGGAILKHPVFGNIRIFSINRKCFFIYDEIKWIFEDNLKEVEDILNKNNLEDLVITNDCLGARDEYVLIWDVELAEIAKIINNDKLNLFVKWVETVVLPFIWKHLPPELEDKDPEVVMLWFGN